MNRSLQAAWALLALVSAAVGCELVAAVDREQIPKGGDTTGTGGQGGQGGGEGGAGGGMGGAGGSGGMAAGPPPPPANLSVMSIDVNGIHLTWTNPNPGMAFAKVKILRALNAQPAGPDDAAATLVYSGAAEATSDDLTKLLPHTATDPRAYFYTAYSCTQDDLCEDQGSSTQASPTLVQCLAAGGYTLFWRHASADVCADATNLGTAANTAVPNWWKSCDPNCPVGGGGTATARQLNATGVMESITIGLDMTTRGIPIGQVRSSEFCRCVQTAENMAFPVPIEQEPDLTYFVYDEANRCANSMAMLAEPPAAGTNTALISHAGNLCPNLDQLAWGEAAIFKPNDGGGATYIARVLASEWLALP